MPNIGFEIKRKCKVCGTVFIAKTLDSHYCSPKYGKVAWKRKKDAKAKDAKSETIAHHIPDIREYISVKEAVALFGVERTTLYRLIHTGRIPSINIGKRLTRIKRSDLEQLFHTRQYKPNDCRIKRFVAYYCRISTTWPQIPFEYHKYHGLWRCLFNFDRPWKSLGSWNGKQPIPRFPRV